MLALEVAHKRLRLRVDGSHNLLIQILKNTPRQRYDMIRQQITHSLTRENKLFKSTQRWPHMLRCLSTQLESLCSLSEFLPTAAKTVSKESISFDMSKMLTDKAYPMSRILLQLS